MENSQLVGATIKRTRVENRLTQMQLAELAGVSERTLRDIESGDGNPSFGAVNAVLGVLGLRMDIS